MKAAPCASSTWLLILVMGCLPGVARTQQVVSNAFTEQELRTLGNITPYSPGVTGFDNRYEGVKGTPYWYDNWQSGYVVVQGKGKLEKSIPLQLDAYNHFSLLFPATIASGKLCHTLPSSSITDCTDLAGKNPATLSSIRK